MRSRGRTRAMHPACLVVKAARVAAGMTLAQLAEAMGLRPESRGGNAALSKIEHGANVPTHDRLAAVAKATGRTIVVTYAPDGVRAELQAE